MPTDDIELTVDLESAIEQTDDWSDDLEAGAVRAVNQLTVLGENAMKREAPEGAGFDPPALRPSIQTIPPRSTETKERTIRPTKRTDEGWLLARAIVGNPSTPTYDDDKPPVRPLIEWADAKFADPSLGWAIRESIFASGHATFPNRFVSRSIDEWESDVEAVAGRAIRDALS